MKTKTFLILLLLGSANICLGQKDTIVPRKIILGVSIGVMPSYITGGLDYQAHFTIEKGKSFFALGPIVGRTNKMDLFYDRYHNIGQYALNGFHTVYQINPNPKGKRFNFYFQNDFIFLYYTDKGTTENVYQYNSYYYPLTKSYKSRQTQIEDFIGYGFKVKFLKNFYMNQSIGVGLVYNSTIIDYGDVNFNRRSKWIEPGAILKLGLGYTFVQNKQSKIK